MTKKIVSAITLSSFLLLTGCSTNQIELNKFDKKQLEIINTKKVFNNNQLIVNKYINNGDYIYSEKSFKFLKENTIKMGEILLNNDLNKNQKDYKIFILDKENQKYIKTINNNINRFKDFFKNIDKYNNLLNNEKLSEELSNQVKDLNNSKIEVIRDNEFDKMNLNEINKLELKFIDVLKRHYLKKFYELENNKYQNFLDNDYDIFAPKTNNKILIKLDNLKKTITREPLNISLIKKENEEIKKDLKKFKEISKKSKSLLNYNEEKMEEFVIKNKFYLF